MSQRASTIGPRPRVMTVRPYWSRIRSRMVTMLQQAGLHVDEALAVDNGTSDEDAIPQILRANPEVLLVPFHAHRDAQGQALDGLTLCRKLFEATGPRPLPVLMPVTPMAAASVRLMSSAGEHADAHADLLATVILLIEEDQVDAPDMPARVIAHLRRVGR